MEAAGLTEDDINKGDLPPYIVSFIGAVDVADIRRHVLVMAGLVTIGGGFMVGLHFKPVWRVEHGPTCEYRSH